MTKHRLVVARPVPSAVTDRAGVVAWQEHATSLGIESDLQDVDFGHALMIKDPDGNQIEFFAPPAQN